MSHPTKSQTLIRRARETGTFERVTIPRVTCPRCGREVYALPDGSPRGHLRDTRPGEPLHSEIVPTKIDCGE
jgi:hypothetical protein